MAYYDGSFIYLFIYYFFYFLKLFDSSVGNATDLRAIKLWNSGFILGSDYRHVSSPWPPDGLWGNPVSDAVSAGTCSEIKKAWSNASTIPLKSLMSC
jgi:hypothetical protein